METKEHRWKSEEGLEYFAWSARGKTAPQAVVAIVHGLGEHAGRYRDWAERLCRENFGFVAMDYRGHGRSQGKKGHTPSYASLMDDINLFVRHSRELFPGIPLVLYGHSLGGNLALNYTLDHPRSVDLLVLTGPWLRLAFDIPAPVRSVGRVLRALFPGLVQGNKLEQEALSRDPEIVRAYREDPLVHDRISLNMLFSVVDNGLLALQQGGRLSVPTLVMHGEADRITSCPASRELAETNPGLISLKTWPGYYHEIHNEPGKEEVFEYLASWLKQQLDTKPGYGKVQDHHPS